MKEAVPRIFRSLEMPRGQAGFDAIVAAAVAAYGSLRSPTEAQARDFGRLVAPLWERTDMETRRALSAALSHTPRMPREIVDLLVEAPVEVAAPFLVSTPTLTSRDVARLAARDDERLARILVGRRERGLLADAGDLAGSSDRPAPRRPVDAPPLSPESLGTRPAGAPGTEAAEFVRATLRRLARTAWSADPRHAEPIGEALICTARSGDQSAFFDMLQARLGLSAGERAAIEADSGGHRLARVLKELRMGTGEALAILMLVRPSIGLHVAAFEAMTAHYRSLEVSERQEAQAVSTAPPLLRKPAARTETQPEGSVRTPFGRRQETPADNRKKSKG